MKRALLCTLTLALVAATACTPAQRAPETIRQDAAEATSEATKDAKAVVQGISDGIKNQANQKTQTPLNINSATSNQLESLPGIDAPRARRIIAGRPYTTTGELVKRHRITKPEYDRISSQVVAQ